MSQELDEIFDKAHLDRERAEVVSQSQSSFPEFDHIICKLLDDLSNSLDAFLNNTISLKPAAPGISRGAPLFGPPPRGFGTFQFYCRLTEMNSEMIVATPYSRRGI